MFEIVQKQTMAQGTIIRFDIAAPRIATKILPGQFVILRVNEQGERIPLTVADVDRNLGTITIIFQIVGKSTALMSGLNPGDFFKDIVGPLGKAAHCTKVDGKVLVIGGGTGVAILHHVAKGMKEAGNYVIGIMGARTQDMLILEDEMKALSDELTVCTDDGSYGYKGFVTQPLVEYIEKYDDIKLVYAIGPIVMMKNVVNVTKPKNIPTMVSLNPVMIDGTGMCGGCRVSVGGKTQFCCVDGPDFDGFEVDFDGLIKRNSMYTEDERSSLLFSVK